MDNPSTINRDQAIELLQSLGYTIIPPIPKRKEKIGFSGVDGNRRKPFIIPVLLEDKSQDEIIEKRREKRSIMLKNLRRNQRSD
jgi:hypothetical protein